MPDKVQQVSCRQGRRETQTCLSVVTTRERERERERVREREGELFIGLQYRSYTMASEINRLDIDKPSFPKNVNIGNNDRL